MQKRDKPCRISPLDKGRHKWRGQTQRGAGMAHPLAAGGQTGRGVEVSVSWYIWSWKPEDISMVVSALLGHNEVEAAEVRIVGQGTLSLGAVVHTTANQQAT